MITKRREPQELISFLTKPQNWKEFLEVYSSTVDYAVQSIQDAKIVTGADLVMHPETALMDEKGFSENSIEKIAIALAMKYPELYLGVFEDVDECDEFIARETRKLDIGGDDLNVEFTQTPLSPSDPFPG